MEYQEWYDVIDWDDELFVTDVIMNQQIRDNLNFLRHPAFAVVNGIGIGDVSDTTATLTTGVEGNVPFDTVITSSPPDFATQIIGPGVMTFRTIQYPGIYFITTDVQFASNATGDRYIEITKNSGTLLGMVRVAALTTGVKLLTCSTMAVLAKGDKIYVNAFQDSGGDLNLSEHADGYLPTLAITHLGDIP
jgi:hypothetical protein